MAQEQDSQTARSSNPSRLREPSPASKDEELVEWRRTGFKLGPLRRLIKRNILLIAGTATLLTILIAASALKATRTYEGSFRILVEPITSDARYTDPSVLARQQNGGAGDGQLDYPTLLQVLQSPELLSRILRERIHPRYPAVTLDSLRRDLIVQRPGTTILDSPRMIEVRYTGADAAQVEFILQQLSDGFLNYSLEDRQVRIGAGVKFIEDQLPTLQQKVDDLQLQVQDLLQEYGLTDPVAKGTELNRQKGEVDTQLLDTQKRLLENQALYDRLAQQLSLSPQEKLSPQEVLTAVTLSAEPRYQALLSQLSTVKTEIAAKQARFQDDSPVITTLKDKQKNLEQLLGEEERRILGSPLARSPRFQDATRVALIQQMITSANQVAALNQVNNTLKTRENELNQQVQQFPQQMRRYTALQQKLEVATKTLNQFLMQRSTLRVEAAQKTIPWQVVAPPVIPRDPTGRPVPTPSVAKKRLPLGVIGGVVLGVLLAWLLERTRNVFPTTEDIQDAIDLPVLGVVPYNQLTRASHFLPFLNGTATLDSNPAASALFLESFNALYASICFLFPQPPIRSVVISSAGAGEGKTTVAVHLAQAVAAMGKQVLLVDANFRNPQIHNLFELSNLKGLSDLLTQNIELTHAVQSTPLVERLQVLTAGPIQPEATSLLASPKMQGLMAQFREQYDFVIYDTPHLLGISDANFLGANTDGVLMVVGIGTAKSSVVMQVMEMLNSFRLPVLGTIANHQNPKFRGSYGYYTSTYRPKQRVPVGLAKRLKLLKPSLTSTIKETDDARS